jgi:hypothetical protein
MMAPTQRVASCFVNRVDRERLPRYAEAVLRLGLVVLLLAIAAVARAEDEEQLLETPPAQGIPERMQELQKEWSEDVGTKDEDVELPEPAPLDEAHDAARGAEDDEPERPQVVTPPRPAEEPPPAKKSSSLESPIRRVVPERPTVRGTPPPAPKDDAAPPAKPSPRPTAPEE